MRTTAVAFLMVLAVFCLAAESASQAPADVQALVRTRCTACHNLNRVRDKVGKNTVEDWTDYISRMQKRGARVDDAQKVTMAAYLAALPSGDGL